MIARLIRGGASLLTYFCVATLIAQVVLFAYLSVKWKLDRDKVVQILAVVQGVDLFEIKKAADGESEAVSAEQASYRQILEARSAKVHHIQLREQALRDGVSQLAFEQRKLSDEQRRFRTVKKAFQQELAGMQDTAVVAGTEDVRTKLEGIKPRQAKELLLKMLKNEDLDDVVTLMKAMPMVKAAKIMGEFKTPEETEQLYEILERIGAGFPDAKLAADTQKRLEEPGSVEP